jgi:adenine phosphoribosyltransferase
MNLKSKIREVPDWPKKGVNFKDITTLLEDKETFKYVIDKLCEAYESENNDGILNQVQDDKKVDKLVAIDARGFILASAMAYKMGVGVCLVRKKGKLPYKTKSRDYDLEYGSNTIEMHEDSIHPGEKVVIVDDLIATGGTMLASCELVEEMGGEILGISCIIDLPFLGGSQKLEKYKLNYLVSYDSE